MIPNATGIVRKSKGLNAHGEPQVETPGLPERFGVVKLNQVATQTGIRAAESASRGNAREPIVTAVLLAMPDTRVAVDDQVEIYGVKTRIVGIQPRLRAQGGLDHYELTGERWD